MNLTRCEPPHVSIGKTQWVRLYVDVLFFPIALTWIATRERPLQGSEKVTLITIGVMTAIFNGYNYLRQKESEKLL